jgi:hypothetical protein
MAVDQGGVCVRERKKSTAAAVGPAHSSGIRTTTTGKEGWMHDLPRVPGSKSEPEAPGTRHGLGVGFRWRGLGFVGGDVGIQCGAHDEKPFFGRGVVGFADGDEDVIFLDAEVDYITNL